VAEVRVQRPVRLPVLGDGPIRADVERAAADLDVDSKPQLLDNRTDVSPHLAHADVTIDAASYIQRLTRTARGMPVAATEAA